MDLTAFGPYALNVRTNISSYGPRTRLIRAYYHRKIAQGSSRFYSSHFQNIPNIKTFFGYAGQIFLELFEFETRSLFWDTQYRRISLVLVTWQQAADA